MRVRTTVWPVLAMAGAALLCLSGMKFILSDGGTTTAAAATSQGREKPLEVRLRSFASGASGRLTVLPDERGGRVRLTALHLPRPQTLDARAREFVVWAVAPGGRLINLGSLERDERGNGGLEFPTPAALERYSVIITAETSASVRAPLGAPVLSTKAGEVIAIFETGPINTVTARDASAPSSSSMTNRRRDGGADFYSEIDQAVKGAEGRTLIFIGSGLAPRARGLARVGWRNGKAFVRARITRLPLPSSVGANTYVLWARAPDGRIAYLGSLPSNINHTEIYVRAGLAFNQFDLFVTAEMQRPVLSPSIRRTLGTTFARRTGNARRRFWRRRKARTVRHAN